MKSNEDEVRLQGQGVSGGIAIGQPFLQTLVEDTIIPLGHSLDRDQITTEIGRYREALEQSRLDLKSLRERLVLENANEGAEIIEAQLVMMDDPLLTVEVEKEIRKVRHSADTVFCNVVQRCEERFRALADPSLRDYYGDIEDVSRRVLRYLRSRERPTLADVPAGSVVFARELVATDAAEALEGNVAAFVTEKGGMTSHAAIVARAGHVPFVTHVNSSWIKRAAKATTVIVDGGSGEVIVNPSKATLAKYRGLKEKATARQQGLQEIGKLKPETFDGHEVRLSANLEIESDLEALHRVGSSGVGLFRSEYLMLASDRFPSEAEQFICYRRIVRQMRGLPVVIRAFDVGGDKTAIATTAQRDHNSYLGWRAIRFLLREPHIFRTQLRAILRASVYGDVGIMFPLVSGLQELQEAKQLLQEERQQLIEEGYTLADRVRIGCMIEVPSAAIICDLLAKECDFLSIGTNDLVQYSLAVDRGNSALSSYYTPTHPGVIRLMRLIVSEASRCGIPVTVCGEVAADPRYTALLLGLGIQELSVSPRHIPTVKNAIRSTSFVQARRLAEQVLTLTTPAEILELLIETYERSLPAIRS